jgi:hypothetical protein
LWRHIEIRGAGECWPWTGSTKAGGYGGVWLGDGSGKIMRAHRAVWELLNGPISAGSGYHGTCVLHRCDNRACCNPAHLFLGTHAQNMHDRDGKGRHARLRGEENPFARITEDLVRLFRASPKSGAELAREYGFDRSTVNLIRSGKRWKHVT